jgi:hypothetical protein
VSWLLLTKVVGRSVPFHRTTEVATKFKPATNKVKACRPTGAPLGKRELIVGTGFVPTLTMLKFSVFEVPPPGPGLKTVTATVPVAAMSLAEI